MRKALFILGELTDGDMDWLAEAGQRQEIAPESILIQRGEPIADVYILLDGRLSVRIDGRDSQEINALLPGEFIGELSFLDSRPPSATVIASTKSIVAAISRDQLVIKLRDDTAFAARFYRALGVFLAHRLRRMTLQGTEASDSGSHPAGETAEDELDPQLLESISLAGKRFEWFQSRFDVA